MASKNSFNKKISGLKVREAREVFEKKGGRWHLKNPTKIFGRIDKEVPGVICERTSSGTKYKEDFNKLPKTNKREIVDKFYNRGNHNRKVLYLVESDFDEKKTVKRKTTNKSTKQPEVTVNVNLKMDKLVDAVTEKTVTTQIETSQKELKGKKNKTEKKKEAKEDKKEKKNK